MKFEFDDFNFKDQIEFMNLNNQMKQNQLEDNHNIGFNNDVFNFTHEEGESLHKNVPKRNVPNWTPN